MFNVGAFPVSAYSLFMVLAISVAALIYLREARKRKQVNEFSFLIAVGAFVGSAIGAKLLEVLMNVDLLHSQNDFLVVLFSGRTIVGGLIGGTLGVWFTKRMIGMHEKRGNLFAPAVAMGVVIGRIGCFFNGCCCGKPSDLPWAVDFGDGVMRHPTQLYESLFMLIMFFVIHYGFKKNNVPPGYLFKILMIGYFIFRFSIEFVRVERVAFWGLTYFQFISLFVLIYLVLSDHFQFIKQIKNYGKQVIG